MLIFASSFISIGTLANTSHSSPYQNEHAITFTAGDQSVAAFEGTIKVLENRNNPKSRMINIKYVRFPSTSQTARPPIVYLAGGPGGSGINTAKHFRFPLFMKMRAFGDVIALDQRGTGLSNDLPQCVSSVQTSLTDVINNELITSNYQTAAKECLEFWKNNNVDIYGYTTVQNALDLNDLRLHFNAEKIALWGISYGSHLALAATKLMEQHIDKIVIASAEGLNQTVKLPSQTDAYFLRLEQAINNQSPSPINLITLIQRVHKQLDANPIAITFMNKQGTKVDMLFQTPHLQITSSAMISDPGRGVPFLLALYKSLDEGDVSVLQQILGMGFFTNDPIRFNPMSFAMDIASGITDERLALVEHQAETSLLGAYLNFPMPHLNKLDKLDLGNSFRTKPKNAIPTLLLTGTLDGRTYPLSQTDAVSDMTEVTQIIIENAGHNLFMSSPEVTETIEAFMANKPIAKHVIHLELPSLSMPKS